MIGKFAWNKGDGEGNWLAIGGPTAITIEPARLGCVLPVVHRAVAAQKEALVPGGADIAGVRGQPHAQPQAGIGRAQAAQNVAHLLFCVQRRFIEADERVARPEVFPHVVVRLQVSKADRRAGGKAPGPFGGAYEDAAQGGVEPARLVDNIRHLHEGGAEDDGAQVGVLMLLHRVHQHGFGLQRAGGPAEEQDVRFRIERSLLCGCGRHPVIDIPDIGGRHRSVPIMDDGAFPLLCHMEI